MTDTSPTTMGVNFSNGFMVPPVDPKHAAQQIAALPVTRAKTFAYRGADNLFIAQAATDKLRLAVGIPNGDLQTLSEGNTQPLIDAIRPYAASIDWLCVGNEPFGDWYGGAYLKLLVPAMRNVQGALQKAGLGKIGVTVPQNFSIMGNSFPPSAGAFDARLKPLIVETCQVMEATGAPFMVNIYPFLAYLGDPQQIPLDYCLFTAPPEHWIKDGAYTYKNIFDAMLDALHVALDGIGLSRLDVVVGECGWPTAGAAAATIANARLFNQNMIDHCKSTVGTPRRPGKPIPCYLFEMYDEANKPPDPGPFERVWGVTNSSLQAKYPLNW